MKNKHAEKLYKSAKAHLKKKTSRKMTDGKYLVYHSYYDENGKLYHDKGHWDDVGVVQGSIFNVIFWTHPRYMFAEEIRSKSYELVTTRFNFDDAIKVFKKVGKSRKKVSYYKHAPIEGDSEDRLSYDDAFKKVLAESDYKQKCEINVCVKGTSRFITVCYPPEFEVVNEETLIKMADEVMEFSKDYSKFYEKYGNYEYGREDYQRENDVGANG